MTTKPPVGPGGRRADLHAHTHFSDGAHAPEQVIERARTRDLAALAITDHDTVEGLSAAHAAAQRAGTTLEFVPGIELSTMLGDQELHILGYYFDHEDPVLGAHLARFRVERTERVHAMVDRLIGLGVRIDVTDVVAGAGPGVIGRPHVAMALIRAGHVATVDEAFKRYLGRHAPGYVPRAMFRPEDAIQLLHAAGGVSVLAHPGATLSDHVVDQLVAEGLRGLEVWHPQHTSAVIRRWREYARVRDLLETGGSDFHGPGRSADLGDVTMPVRALARLKQAAGVAG